MVYFWVFQGLVYKSVYDDMSSSPADRKPVGWWMAPHCSDGDDISCPARQASACDENICKNQVEFASRCCKKTCGYCKVTFPASGFCRFDNKNHDHGNVLAHVLADSNDECRHLCERNSLCSAHAFDFGRQSHRSCWIYKGENLTHTVPYHRDVRHARQTLNYKHVKCFKKSNAYARRHRSCMVYVTGGDCRAQPNCIWTGLGGGTCKWTRLAQQMKSSQKRFQKARKKMCRTGCRWR